MTEIPRLNHIAELLKQGSKPADLLSFILRARLGPKEAIGTLVEAFDGPTGTIQFLETAGSSPAAFVEALLGAQEKPAPAKKTFANMTNAEVELAVRQIVGSSSSEDEVLRRIVNELRYPHDQDIDMTCSLPNDQTGWEACLIVIGLGGPVLKNGAMVSIMLPGHHSEFIII